MHHRPRTGSVFPFLAVSAVTLGAVSVDAEEIFPGMSHSRIAAFGQIAHVVEVDLSRPEYFLRANREDEGRQTPGAYGESVGAAAVINGDWDTLEGATTFGLAVGNGWQWAGRNDPPNEGAPHDWSFFACTAEKRCHIDPPLTQTEWRHRWIHVIGGNDAVLVIDGIAQANDNPHATYANRHPRSAICVDEGGMLLRLIAIQGRRADSAGMTWTETANFVHSLGCHEALMLDGGGSTSLIANGRLLNDRPDNEPNQRPVISQLAIMRNLDVDPACVGRENGRHCDGHTLVTCQGGLADPGDCGFFGLSCVEAHDTAFCLDPVCRNGPDGLVCRDANVIVQCEFGQPLDEHCDAFGLSCGEAEGTAFCVDPRCVHGGHHRWCDGQTAKTCTLGGYVESACAESGLACDEGECVHGVDPRCEGREGQTSCEAERLVTCREGAYLVDEDCARDGKICRDFRCVDPRCHPVTDGATCDGDTLVVCADALAQTTDCTATGGRCVDSACVTVEGEGEGEGAETDARCQADPEAIYCEGTTLVQCRAGQASVSDCALDGRVCEGNQCVPSSDPTGEEGNPGSEGEGEGVSQPIDPAVDAGTSDQDPASATAEIVSGRRDSRGCGCGFAETNLLLRLPLHFFLR